MAGPPRPDTAFERRGEWYYQAGWDPGSAWTGWASCSSPTRCAPRCDGMTEYRFLRGGEAFKARFGPRDDGLVNSRLARGAGGRALLAAAHGAHDDARLAGRACGPEAGGPGRMGGGGVTAPDVLVLCYHAVSERWRSPLTISPGALEHQLTRVLARGYEPVTFTQGGARPARRPHRRGDVRRRFPVGARRRATGAPAPRRAGHGLRAHRAGGPDRADGLGRLEAWGAGPTPTSSAGWGGTSSRSSWPRAGRSARTRAPTPGCPTSTTRPWPTSCTARAWTARRR